MNCFPTYYISSAPDVWKVKSPDACRQTTRGASSGGRITKNGRTQACRDATSSHVDEPDQGLKPLRSTEQCIGGARGSSSKGNE